MTNQTKQELANFASQLNHTGGRDYLRDNENFANGGRQVDETWGWCKTKDGKTYNWAVDKDNVSFSKLNLASGIKQISKNALFSLKRNECELQVPIIQNNKELSIAIAEQYPKWDIKEAMKEIDGKELTGISIELANSKCKIKLEKASYKDFNAVKLEIGNKSIPVKGSKSNLKEQKRKEQKVKQRKKTEFSR